MEPINELSAALSRAQAHVLVARKESRNPFFKSNYADLESVWGACREALTENGLAIIQVLDTREGQLYLETLLTHSSGQWVKSVYPINPVKSDPQGVGSAITYARRYALAAMVGVVASDEDDDGEAATRGAPAKADDKPTAEESELVAAMLEKLLNCKSHKELEAVRLALSPAFEVLTPASKARVKAARDQAAKRVA